MASTKDDLLGVFYFLGILSTILIIFFGIRSCVLEEQRIIEGVQIEEGNP